MRFAVHITAVGTALLATAAGGLAQPSSQFEVGGYAKSLLSVTKPPAGEGRTDALLHLRLNTAWVPLDVLRATLEMRFRAYAGETVEQTPRFADRLRNPSLAWDLDRVFWSGRQTVGFGEIDRMALTWSPPGAQVSVGRQRIAWGTNLVWNPIDVFNPLSILDFDYEERPAVDAARVQWYTGEVSKLEGAVKFAQDGRDVIAAGMWSFNVREFDLRLCAGGREGNGFLGGAWAGDILGGGFRGEILTSPGGGGRWNLSAALSGDYTFPSTLYLHAELLVDSFRPTTRYSIYQEVAVDLTPLVRGSLFAIFNPDDHSSVLVPSVSWSAAENFDVMGLFIVAGGREGTEYGDYGRTAFLRLRYSF